MNLCLEFVISRFNEDISETLDFLFDEIYSQVKHGEQYQCTFYIYNKDSTDPDSTQLLHSINVCRKRNLLPLSNGISSNNLSFPTRNSSLQFSFHFCSLPNTGREGQTYLFHIIHNYDVYKKSKEKGEPKRICVFLAASCVNERKRTMTRRIIKTAFENKDSTFYGLYYSKPLNKQFYSFKMESWEGTTTENVKNLPSKLCYPAAYRPFGLWFNHYFPSCSDKVHIACYNGLFAVATEHIMNHDIPYYQELLSDLDVHSNPEAGHFLERSWIAVFSPIPVSIMTR